MFQTIGLIGTGNMGSAVLKAILKENPSAAVYLNNRTREKAEKLAALLPNAAVCEAKEIAQKCDTIILGVKPQNLKEVAVDIAPVLQSRSDRFIILTMLAGFTAKEVQEAFGIAQPVIFLMPNTPILVGSGVILYNSVDATPEEESIFEKSLRSAGCVEKCNLSEIGPAGSLTGCGPAMIYMLLAALTESLVKQGVPQEKAERYAALMTEGSARMSLLRPESNETLKRQVCSPRGITIQMVENLEKNRFSEVVEEGMTTAIFAKPQ